MAELRSLAGRAKSGRKTGPGALRELACAIAALASLWAAGAQAAAPGPRVASANQTIVGTWQGTLHAANTICAWWWM